MLLQTHFIYMCVCLCVCVLHLLFHLSHRSVSRLAFLSVWPQKPNRGDPNHQFKPLSCRLMLFCNFVVHHNLLFIVRGQQRTTNISISQLGACVYCLSVHVCVYLCWVYGWERERERERKTFCVSSSSSSSSFLVGHIATIVTWLILPVVICLSQRLSHACLSINALYCETANGSLNQLLFI